MKKYFLLLLLVIIAALSCVQATDETIVGVWKEILDIGFVVPTEDIYFKFKDNNRYVTWPDKNFPSEDYIYFDYKLTNGKLTTANGTFDAYISGIYMYWYQGNIEAYRFQRE